MLETPSLLLLEMERLRENTILNGIENMAALVGNGIDLTWT